jgi:hypothetical protein
MGDLFFPPARVAADRSAVFSNSNDVGSSEFSSVPTTAGSSLALGMTNFAGRRYVLTW